METLIDRLKFLIENYPQYEEGILNSLKALVEDEEENTSISSVDVQAPITRAVSPDISPGRKKIKI